jgi:uncharacterized protein YceH (UPF0502 family)
MPAPPARADDAALAARVAALEAEIEDLRARLDLLEADA